MLARLSVCIGADGRIGRRLGTVRTGGGGSFGRGYELHSLMPDSDVYPARRRDSVSRAGCDGPRPAIGPTESAVSPPDVSPDAADADAAAAVGPPPFQRCAKSPLSLRGVGDGDGGGRAGNELPAPVRRQRTSAPGGGERVRSASVRNRIEQPARSSACRGVSGIEVLSLN